jgi:hypothetical protein
VPFVKGAWLALLTLRDVGKASKQYGLFCWCSNTAKETMIIEARTNARIARFSVGCIILRL